MAQADTPGPETVLLLVASALRIADELGLYDAAIDLNAALLKLGAAVSSSSVLNESATRIWPVPDEEDDEL